MVIAEPSADFPKNPDELAGFFLHSVPAPLDGGAERAVAHLWALQDGGVFGGWVQAGRRQELLRAAFMNLTKKRKDTLWRLCNESVEGITASDAEYICEQWWAEIQWPRWV